MRWKKSERSKRTIHHWHVWFAWYPVTVSGEVVWLEKVERRGDKFNKSFSPVRTFEYRNPDRYDMKKVL